MNFDEVRESGKFAFAGSEEEGWLVFCPSDGEPKQAPPMVGMGEVLVKLGCDSCPFVEDCQQLEQESEREAFEGLVAVGHLMEMMRSMFGPEDD